MKQTVMMKYFALGLCAVMMASASMGCKSKKEPQVIDTTGQTPVSDRDPSMLPDIDPSTLSFTKSVDLQTIYFDYDSSSLRPDALSILARNAETMKRKAGNVYFQVQGNCDERGTQEYNLALGERRALAVRSHLISLGVDSQRILTVSFGEENPVAYGSNEAAWSQNRRADFGEAVASR